jgi:hypothetical protein
MWAKIITLQRTIHTPTPTMQGGEPTPIFHGVTLRMCKLSKGSKYISNREITIKLSHKAVQPNLEPKKNDLEDALLKFLTEHQQTNAQASQAIQRLETQVGQLAKELSERKRGEFPMEAHCEQIINHIKRERELQSQLVANPSGYYVEDWSSSYLEQAITTLRSEEVVENHKKEGKEEQIEVTHDLHQEKGKEVSTEAYSASTPIPELPRGHESSLLGLLDKQIEVIKVEKLFMYSPHSIPVHDSLPDEKLFENS